MVKLIKRDSNTKSKIVGSLGELCLMGYVGVDSFEVCKMIEFFNLERHLEFIENELVVTEVGRDVIIARLEEDLDAPKQVLVVTSASANQGLAQDKELVARYLEFGKLYTVKSINEESFRTEIQLNEVEEDIWFNNINFEDYLEVVRGLEEADQLDNGIENNFDKLDSLVVDDTDVADTKVIGGSEKPKKAKKRSIEYNETRKVNIDVNGITVGSIEFTGKLTKPQINKLCKTWVISNMTWKED